jgi:hypothetical protein
MLAYPWTDALLDTARQTGDPKVDPLARSVVYGSPAGARDYHRMLGLSDTLARNPELWLADDSRLTAELKAIPEEFTSYFDPAPAPAWVDADKLALAGRIWDENQIAIIGVLYAASLPACYLIARGIPALYDTGKLGQYRFIYQRIYETGLMLDAVMEAGGVTLVDDLASPPGAAPLPRARRWDNGLLGDPEGGWGAIPTTPHRYLWGKGLVAARKVRLLHAGMRAMLLQTGTVGGGPGSAPQGHGGAHGHGAPHGDGHPHANANGHGRPSLAALADRAKPYPADTLGVPVNQEDLAYTLLTFAYVIPMGLEQYGCRLTLAEKEAFLHRWRVVGHLMGIVDELLPDSWAAAADLFATVQRRQAFLPPEVEASLAPQRAMSRRLTSTLNLFLASYLPPALRTTVPTMLIRRQLGDKAATLVLPTNAAKPGVFLSLAYDLAMFVLRLYFPIKRWLSTAIPPLGALIADCYHRAGDALIDSWRDGYARAPFDIAPQKRGDWVREQGWTPAFEREVRAWRGRLFNTVLLGVAGGIGGAVLVVVAAVLTCCALVPLALLCAGLGTIAGIVGLYVLGHHVSVVASQRPKRSLR